MAIQTIYIRNKNGTLIGKITRPLMLNAALIKLAGSGHSLTISCPASIYKSPAATAYNTYSKGLLLSVNGAKPDSTGSVWINTDACMSVVPVYAGSHGQTTGSGKIGGIAITNTCTSPLPCSRVESLRVRIEHLKACFNSLKDANLYSQEICNLRRTYMVNSRLALPASCLSAAGTALDAYMTIPPVIARELIPQYITAVHMFNYAVSEENTTTAVSVAMDDTAGISIRTQHAIPACTDGTAPTGRISCKITIEESAVENGLSMYVATPSTLFKPFAAGTIGASDAAVSHVGYTKKVIQTKTWDVTVAGTYEVAVHAYPFLYTTATCSDGSPISLTAYSMTTIVQDTGASHADASVRNQLLKLAVSAQSGRQLAPTEQQYKDSRLIPSKAPEGYNRWKVTIEWKYKMQGDANEVATTRTYYAETAAVRKAMTDITADSTWTTYAQDIDDA